MRRSTLLRTLLLSIIVVGVIVASCLMLFRKQEVNSLTGLRMYNAEKIVEHTAGQEEEAGPGAVEKAREPLAATTTTESAAEERQGGLEREKDMEDREDREEQELNTQALVGQTDKDKMGQDMEESSEQKKEHNQIEGEEELSQEYGSEEEDTEETTILGESSRPLPAAPVPLWQPKGEGPYRIRYVALIAERHSGSTWMYHFLSDYFKPKKVFVTSTLCTWKHWFQDRIHADIQAKKRPCRKAQQCPACLDIQHTLVIAMWRNPYDWIGAMQKTPHHSKTHFGIQDGSEFMTKRWMLTPKNERAARADALVKAENKAPCIDNFLPSEVVPCRPNDRSAIYELDENGEAYGNVYELRKAKIRDFNAVQKWAPYYEKILYEDMVDGNKLQEWLRSLDTKYGLRGDYEHVPGAQLLSKMSLSGSYMYYLNSETCAPHCAMGGPGGEGARATLHTMWDDQLEEGLGYHRMGSKAAA